MQEKVLDCLIGLPKGHTDTATKKGIIKLTGDLRLENKIYVPELNCSL